MAQALLEPPMTNDKPKASSMKVHDDVIEMARVVSACRGETMTELVSALLRPLLAVLQREEMAKRLGGNPKPKGKAKS